MSKETAGGAPAFNEQDVKPTVGIITALPHEYAAVKVLLESQRPIFVPGRGANRQYLYGEVPAPDCGRHRIVLALLPDTGNNHASARAALLIEHFPSVRIVIMSGIAGGVPNPNKSAEHVRLGDVVVTNREGVIQYDFGKEELGDGKLEFTPRHPPRPPSASLVETARLLQAGELEGERPWVRYINLGLERLSASRPPAETDVLVSSTDPDEVIAHPSDTRRLKDLPRVFLGPIASSNTLLKNPLKRDQLQDRFGVKAVEMEGSGIADAAWTVEVQYLVVRGVCDYCDRNKGDDWQLYAAVVAAAYTRALLEATPAGASVASLPEPAHGAALNVLSSQLESASSDLSDEKLDRLEDLRELFREGAFNEAYEGVRQFRKSPNWNVFSGRLRAAVLRALATMTLSLKKAGGVAEATKLAEDARSAEPSEDDVTLRARIKIFAEGYEAALEELTIPRTPDGFNLRIGLLIETGRLDEALEALRRPPEGMSFDAETHRLYALALLASKDIQGAREHISQALAERPRRPYVRLNAAMIDYLSALSPVALPHHLIPYPRPVPPSMVKSDVESRERILRAAEECKRIAEQSAMGGDELKNVEAWRVACLASLPDLRPEATELCKKCLAEDPADVRIIPWVLFHGYDIDLSPSAAALERSPGAPGGDTAELETVVALVGIYRKRGAHQKALELLVKKRETFDSADQLDLWHFWRAQLLAAAGQPEVALDDSSQVEDRTLRHSIRSTSLCAIANRTGDWRPLISYLEKSYEEENDVGSLLTLCEIKGQLGDWPYVADRAELYCDAAGTAAAARFAFAAAWNARRPGQCLRLIDKYSHLFPNGILPADLRTLRVHCLINTGDIKAAQSEAEKLAQDDPGVESAMLLMDVQLTKGDLTGIEVTARRLLNQSDLTSGQLLRAAHLAQLKNPTLAKKFWTRAVEGASDDPDLTAFAVQMAAKLGVENQRGSLMQRMMEYASQGQGPVQAMTMEQTLEVMREGWQRQEQLRQMYASGEAPLQLWAKGRLAQVFRGLAESNADLSDAHRRTRILVRHGGRTLLPEDYAGAAKNWRLHCDTTSLLLAHELGVLGKIERSFKPLRIPRHLTTALIEQRDKLQPHQQSQLDESRAVLDLVSKGKLHVLEEKPSDGAIDEVRRLVADRRKEVAVTDEPDEGGGGEESARAVINADAANLEQQLGHNRLEMLAAALSEESFAVGFLPVSCYGVSRHVLLGLPGALSNRVINCRAVADCLRGNGRIGEEAYGEGIRALGAEGNEYAAVSPLIGCRLFLMEGVADILARANLLERVCNNFRVFIAPSCVKEAEGRVQHYERLAKIKGWLNELIDRISDGLDDETYEFINITDERVAQRDDREEKLDQGFTATLDLFLFEPQQWDVIWVDDRALNKYPLRADEKGGIPLIGVNEILLALRVRGELDEHDYYDLIQRLRERDFRYIPLDEKEMLHHLREARVENGRVVETDALTSLRRYYASCLLDKDILQLASPGGDAPNPHSELPFVVQIINATANAIADVWADDRTDVETAAARADWLLNNFYTGNYGCSHLRRDDVAPSSIFTPARIIAQDISNLLMRGVSMHGNPLVTEPVQRRNHYFNWLTERIISSSYGSHPDVVKATAKELEERFRLVKGLTAGTPENEPLTRAFMGKFFLDLPDVISNEMELDSEMTEWLRLKLGSIITAAGMSFAAADYWKAVETALAGCAAPVKTHDSDTEYRLVRAPEGGKEGGNGPFPSITVFDSEDNQIGVMSDPLFGVLVPDVQTRRAALERLRKWFDCGQEEFEKEADELASIEDVVARVTRLYEWRTRSSELYYSGLEQKFREREPVFWSDLLPPSAESFAGRLRLPLTLGGKSFSDAWQESADALLREEDLLSAVVRLASVPVAMPQEAVAAVARLPEGERTELFERLAEAWTSPLRRLHLVNLVLRSSPTSEAALEVARRVLEKLYDGEAGAKDFNAFHAVLAFVNEEIETWPEGRRWSREVRLAVIWAHASRLHGMFHGLGYSAEQIVSMVEGARRSSFREPLIRDPETWADCVHPRRVNRTRLLTHAVAGMLAGIDRQVVEAVGVSELIRREVFREVREGIMFLEFSLMGDPALNDDALLSVFGGDRYALLSGMIGPEGIEVLSSERLKQGVKNYLEELTADPARVINWTWIHMVTEGLPLYADLREVCRKALEVFDPSVARKDGFRAAWFIFRGAACQAVNIADESLRQKFRDHLVEMLKSEMAIGPEETSDSEFNSLENRVGALIDVASVLSHVPNDPVRSNVGFTSLLRTMTDLWPDLSRRYRHVLSREVWNLPIEESETWWHLSLRMRASG